MQFDDERYLVSNERVRGLVCLGFDPQLVLGAAAAAVVVVAVVAVVVGYVQCGEGGGDDIPGAVVDANADRLHLKIKKKPIFFNISSVWEKETKSSFYKFVLLFRVSWGKTVFLPGFIGAQACRGYVSTATLAIKFPAALSPAPALKVSPTYLYATDSVPI